MLPRCRLGVSTSNNIIGNTVKAYIDGGKVESTGELALLADETSTIIATTVTAVASVSVASSDDAIAIALGVAHADNDIDNITHAYIANNATAKSGVSKKLSLTADDVSTITAVNVAASVAVAVSMQGTGISVSAVAAAATNTISNSTKAYISNIDVNAKPDAIVQSGGMLVLSATDNSTITATGVAVGIAAVIGDGGAIAFTATISLNDIDNDIYAYISNAKVSAGGIIDMDAVSTSTITATSVAASVSAAVALDGDNFSISGAVAVTVSDNDVQNEVHVYISDNSDVSTTNSGDVSLSATDTATLQIVDVSVSVSVAISNGSVGVGVSVGVTSATNLVRNNMSSYIDDASVVADGAVLLSTHSNATITATSVVAVISVAISTSDPGVTVGVGVAYAKNDIANIVHSYIANNAHVASGTGKLISLSVNDTSTITAVNVAASIALTVASSDVGITINAVLAIAENKIENSVKSYISNIDAVAEPDAIVSSGGGIALTATDNATVTSTAVAAGIGISVGKGSVTINFSATVSLNDIDNSIYAYVSSAKVAAAGDISITSNSISSITATSVAASVAVAVSIGGGSFAVAGAISVTYSTNEINNDTLSYITGKSNVSTSEGGNVSLSAADTSSITAINVVVSVSVSFSAQGASVAVSIAAAHVENTIGNSVKSYIDGTGINNTIVDSSGGISLSSASNATITSTAVAVSVSLAIAIPKESIGIALTGAGANAINTITNSTQSYIIDADVDAVDDITLLADDNNTVTSDVTTVAVSVSLGFALNAAVSLGENTITNTVSAYLDGADVSSSTGGISVIADQHTTATANLFALSLSIAIGGAGAGANAVTTVAGTTSAYIGSTAIIDAQSGLVNIEANSDIYASSEAKGGSGSAIAITVMLAEATVKTPVTAYLAAGSDLKANGLTINANATRRDADAKVISGSVGLLAGSGGKADAKIEGDVHAYIADNTSLQITGGDVNILATKIGDHVSPIDGDTRGVSAIAEGGSGGGINVDYFESYATISGATKAEIGDNVTFTHPDDGAGLDDLSVIAVSDLEARADNFVLGIGVAGGNGTYPTASVTTGVVARIGDNVVIENASGLITVDGSSVIKSSATGDGGYGGGIGGTGIKSIAKILSNETGKALVRASIGDGAQIAAAGFNVIAVNEDNAYADTIVGVGTILVGGGRGEATTENKGGAEAWMGTRFGDDAGPTQAVFVATSGDINVRATSASYANTKALVATGSGIAGGRETYSNITITTFTTAYIGGANIITDVGNVTVHATGIAEGDAKAESYGGALLGDGGAAKTVININQTINAKIGDNSNLNVAGDVLVEAFGGKEEGPGPDPSIISVDGVREMIIFSSDIQVGEGDIVTYNTNTGEDILDSEGQSLNGIESGREYRAMKVVNAVADVVADDGQRMTRSDGADWRDYGFSIGDTILITDAGENNGSYVIDGFENDGGSGTVLVLADGILVAGAARIAITTQTRNKLRLGAGFDGSRINSDLNTITFETDHYLETGDIVRYQVTDGNAIAGLAENTIYYVIKIDNDTIKLVDDIDLTEVNQTGFEIDDIESVEVVTQIAFDDVGDGIEDLNGGDWIDAGFNVGDQIEISGDLFNEGVYTILAIEDNLDKDDKVISSNSILILDGDIVIAFSGSNTITNLSYKTGPIIQDNNLIEGMLVTYEAPQPTYFNSQIVDVFVNNDGTVLTNGTTGEIFHLDSYNQIFVGNSAYNPVTQQTDVEPHDYQTGDEIVYFADGGDAIGSLVSGKNYYVIKLNEYAISLSETDGGIAINLMPDLSELGSQTIHRLVRASDAPIGGLIDGGTYKVVNVSPTQFDLVNIDNSAIVFDVDNLRFDAAHKLSVAGVDITASPVVIGDNDVRDTDFGAIYIDLSNDPSLTGQILLGQGGISYADLSFKAGDGKTWGKAQGGGGAFIEVSVPSSDVYYKADVTASVGTNVTITATGDFSMFAQSLSNAESHVRSDAGGVIKVGISKSKIDVYSNAKVDIGTGVKITAANISLDTNVNNTVKITAIAKGGGVIAAAITVASPKLVTNSIINIGDSVGLVAGNNFSALTRSSSFMEQKTEAEVWGAVGGIGASTNSETYEGYADKLYFDGVSEVKIGRNAVIEAETVSFKATVSKVDIDQSNYAWAIMTVLFGAASAHAYSDAFVNSRANVTILGDSGDTSPGTSITGTRGVDIIAHQTGLSTARNAGRLAVAIVPPQGAFGEGTDRFKTYVNSESGATIFAGPRNDGNTPLAGVAGTLDKVALYVDANQDLPEKTGLAEDKHLDAYYDEDQSNHVETVYVDWDADVVISAGPSPKLVVDEYGNIEEIINVVIEGDADLKVGDKADNDGDGKISVGDIYNDNDSGNVLIKSNRGSVVGGELVGDHYWGTFKFLDSFESVEIINYSTDNLIINNIDLVNFEDQPKVDIHAITTTLTFDLLRTVEPALISIENFSSSNILFQGTGLSQTHFPGAASIENPIGTTYVYNQGGNILSAGSDTIIRTNRFLADAPLGYIGTDTHRINVELVQSEGLPEFISVNAGQDIYLNLKGRLREVLPVGDVFTVDVALIDAGGHADVLLQESVKETSVDSVPAVLVRVKNEVDAFLPFNNFFRPNDLFGPAEMQNMGAYGGGTTAIESTYGFALIEAGEGELEKNITIKAANPDDGSTIINVIANTDIIGKGHIDVDTNGFVRLAEVAGNMRLGLVRSRGNDVTLISPKSIVDAMAGSSLNPTSGDVESDVTGINVDMLAQDGTIGVASNFVNIDTSNRDGATEFGTLKAKATSDIFISEVDGVSVEADDLNIDLVHSMIGDVTLYADDGAILDGKNGGLGNDDANILAINVDLVATAKGEAVIAGIGSQGNYLEIDSGLNSAYGVGRLVAIADHANQVGVSTGIYLEEVNDELNVLKVQSTNGDAYLKVRESSDYDDDFVMAASGQTSVGEIVDHGIINASNDIVIMAGDDFISLDNSTFNAGHEIVVRGDHDNGDALGTDMDIRGSFIAPNITFFGHLDDDLFTFNQTYLGGETFAYGSQSSSPTYLAGAAPFVDDGTDTFIVNQLETMPNGTNRPTLNLDGQSDTDTYLVRTNGSTSLLSDYVINVLDTGAKNDGVDTLTIEGTDDDDLFLLRRANDTSQVNKALGMVAMLHGTLDQALVNDDTRVDTVERINYSENINARLMVLGMDGDDYFASDDNLAITTLDGGAGNDQFQIGQIFGTARTHPDGPNALYEGILGDSQFDTTLTTRGWLSKGNSFAMTAIGGSGADSFTVFSNASALHLEGNAGNDIFTVRAFRLVDPETAALIEGETSSTAITEIIGGMGDDNISYNINAPVSIDGGEGFDRVVVLGTEAADAFIITENSIRGAGLNVSFSGSEEYFEVDGLEGDDTFYILSTSPDAVIKIIGGLGSDTFNVAGDVDQEIVSMDLEGRSGIITHSIEKTNLDRDTSYDNALVAPVNYTIADANNGQIVIDEFNGELIVDENDGNTIAVYDIFLASAPAGVPVYVTVSAARSAYEEETGVPAGDSILISTDGINYSKYAVLTFSDSDGGQANAQRIYVKAAPDSLSEGERVVMISHSVASSDENYNEAQVKNVEVTVLDNDRAGLILSETSGSTLVVGGNLDGGNGPVTGISDSYTFALTKPPAAGKTVTVALTFNPQAIDLASLDARFGLISVDGNDPTKAYVNVSFNDTNWDQAVVIDIAAGDLDPRNTSVYHAISSTDDDFTVPLATRLDVKVYSDNDPDVLVQESNGSTHIVAGETTDDYTIRLTKAPAVGKTVTVQLYQGVKVLLSSADPRFDANTLTVTFDETNWYQEITINVADNPEYVADATEQPVLPPMPVQHQIASIRGPLILEGGISGEDRSIGKALVLPGETNPGAFDILDTTDELKQVDRVNVYNDDSNGTTVATDMSRIDVGELGTIEQTVINSDNTISSQTITHLSGLGMAMDDLILNIGSFEAPNLVSIAAGISYDGMEVMEIMLGRSSDYFTVSETLSTDALHGGSTIIHGGGGDDVITITRRDDGNENRDDTLVVYGDTSQDGTRYGNENPGSEASSLAHYFLNPGNDIINASGSDRTLAIYGGRGDDEIIGSQTDDHLAGGSGNDTIDGQSGVDHIYGDSGFNFDANDTSLVLDDEPGLRILSVPVINTSGLINSDDLVAGQDDISGGDDTDIIFGDHGMITQTSGTLRILTTGEVIRVESVEAVNGDADKIDGGNDNDLIIGGAAGDLIAGGGANDLIFGDHGLVEIDNASVIDLNVLPMSDFAPNYPFSFTSIFTGNNSNAGDDVIYGDGWPQIISTLSGVSTDGDDIILGQQGADTIYGGGGDDDIIGGHNVAGGYDLGDRLDGQAGNDVIAGDNAIILRRGDTVSPRYRVLSGSSMYDENGNALVTDEARENPNGVESRDIKILDHSISASTLTYGDDYIAGGADDDVIFGQLGDDIIQGDGSIGAVDAPTSSGSFVDDDGRLSVSSSFETANDGDDYIEGNGGDDVIFGNLGQDDIVGGSSDMYDGLRNVDQRPDGKDILFGGAGTQLSVARNALGQGAVIGDDDGVGHAFDADVILGDNGNILRLLGVNGAIGNGGDDNIATFNGFLAFNYDNYTDDLDEANQLKIIPRTYQLLDYTFGGDTADIGDTDIIHGGDSDDIIHGMTGNDVLYGDGYDDDIYGGIGHDKIFGGSGEDGILGDDGILLTSRNGMIEPLHQLIVANQEKLIETNDPFIGAVVDITGLLKKNVDLLAWEIGGHDVIYGGLGDDWIHAGAGNDAVSGAEALENTDRLLDFYHNVTALDDTPPIVYNEDNRKLESFNLFNPDGSVASTATAYDADNPRAKIENFFLNFDSFDADGVLIEDGKDRIFGDLGHDWIVGGTGQDRLYGGMGDDYLQMDDNLETEGTDDANYPALTAGAADFAFGGGGLDVMVANTGFDRAFDWLGEFNTFVVPFARFGMGTVDRRPMPDTMLFLEELGSASGMDHTLTEPYGELGLVDQRDDEWQDQNGPPRDPQPGNGHDFYDGDGRKEDDTNLLLTEHGSTPTQNGSGTTQLPDAISIEKAANAGDVWNPTAAEDADTAPGQEFAEDTNLIWTYLVTNTGETDLTNVVVTDDNGTVNTADDFNAVSVEQAGFNTGDLNFDEILNVGETWLFTSENVADYKVLIGDYVNEAIVTASTIGTGAIVTDSDLNHHFADDPTPSIDIEKAANAGDVWNPTVAEDADTAPGQEFAEDTNLIWTYLVTNTGETDLTNVVVRDDNGTVDNADDFVAVSVEQAGFNTGDLNFDEILNVGETWLFTSENVADYKVLIGDYVNEAIVTASAIGTGAIVTDSDLNHHFADDPTPSIDIEKAANAGDVWNPTAAEDADTAPGQEFAEDTNLIWTYLVTNTGETDLTNVVVTDDNGTVNTADDFNAVSVEQDGFNAGDLNTDGILNVGETWLFTSESVADYKVLIGDYVNEAIVTASTIGTGAIVTDSDLNHHFADDPTPSIDIEKAANAGDVWNPTAAEDADTAPGQEFAEDTNLIWTYLVTNTGETDLTNVVVTDDNGTVNTADDFNAVSVEQAGFNTGDLNFDEILNVGETWLFTSENVADYKVLIGDYVNEAIVTASTIGTGAIVTDSDLNHHFADDPTPSIDIEKAANAGDVWNPTVAEDADTAPGQEFAEDTNLIWTYLVTNTGETDLTNVVVRDDNGTVDNADDFVAVSVEQAGFNTGDLNFDEILNVGETWLFTSENVADYKVLIGDYVNEAIVTASAIGTGAIVTDSDLNHHFADDPTPSIDIEKAANALNVLAPTEVEDADTGPGQSFVEGTDVIWTYLVTNTGNSDLINVLVSDDNGTADLADDFEAEAVLDNGYVVGDDNQDGILNAGETWLYSSENVISYQVIEGTYGNEATVTAIVIADETVVSDTDLNYHTGHAEGGGLTPGFWKANAKNAGAVAWPQTADGTVIYDPNDPLSSIFTGLESYGYSDLSLEDALDLNGGGMNALLRHAVAALLNATHTSVAYPMTASEVVTATQNAIDSGDANEIRDLKDLFDTYNNYGADLDQHGRTSNSDTTTTLDIQSTETETPISLFNEQDVQLAVTAPQEDLTDTSSTPGSMVFIESIGGFVGLEELEKHSLSFDAIDRQAVSKKTPVVAQAAPKLFSSLEEDATATTESNGKRGKGLKINWGKSA